MRLECRYCERSFDLPEGKVPQAKRFRFTCPSCRKQNEVDLSEQEPQIPDIPPENVPLGSQVVLVAVQDPEIRQGVEAYFQDQGWHMIQADDMFEAAGKIRSNRVQWVVFEDTQQAPVLLREIGRWPGRERREVNCVLIGERTESFEAQTAFVLGVNSYLHRQPSQGLQAALDQARQVFERSLHIWRVAAKTQE